MNSEPFVSFNNIAKRWNGQLGVENISIDIPEGAFVALLGPSGCGKSTTLRLLAGLEIPDDGQIRIEGADVTEMAPSARNLSMVFQSYALFPHLSVAEKRHVWHESSQSAQSRKTAEIKQCTRYNWLNWLRRKKAR
nr:ATP-binding cassette domain-containing protein [Enterovibrio nigricans]